ncbi:MAG: patatin-like phospholipase family protein, partial [Acholeplasmatales bacterium]|nr:patatin-like phospholipase family protein [Acholeplasmatales bacterium]
MKKGLALCGGGAKGSYEAGCFKAFDKLGIKFDIVTGTSIGCLNAAMYCQHDLKRDYELWEKLDVSMIVKYGFNFDRYDVLNGIKNNKNSISMVLNYVTNRGADIRPLKKLFKEYIDPEKIVNSDITFGIFSAQYPSMKGNEVIANKLDPNLIRDYILSSASCWPVFPISKIGDKSFVDGGYNDNLPINFCLKLGASEVVAIDLNPEPTHPEYLHKSFVKYIRPTHFLGTFMQFGHEQIMQNMALGFLDTMKAYKQYQGYRYTITFEMPDINYQDFTNRIIEIYSYISRNNIKFSKKSEIDKHIFEYLSQYTDSSTLNHKELFIRALEVFAELLDVSYFNVYSISSLIDESINKLCTHDLHKGLFKDLDMQKNYEKKRTYIEKKDKFDLMRYLYNDLLKGNRLNISTLSMIYTTKLDVCIA